ncbi:helix-turn-helix domain-containing protein [Rhizobium leguminosarum]
MTAFFSWQHAIRSSKLESTTKLVCYTIWSHMASDGTGCFPSYALIADESGLGRSTVILHVQKAADAGFLIIDNRERENGSATSNMYRPSMPEVVQHLDGGSPIAGLGVVQQLDPHNNPSLTTQIKNTPIAPKGAAPGFDDFWSIYPNKVGKPKALAVWNRMKPDPSAVMAGIKRWKASDQWVKDGGRFIPHPTTWLNREGWNDAIAGEATAPSPDELKAAEERITAAKRRNDERDRKMVEERCRQLGVLT